VPIVAAFSIAGGNTIEALLGAFLVNRFAGGKRAFDHSPNVFRFVAWATLIATTTSATIGVLTLCLSGSAPWPAFGSVWITWWFGDAMGTLLFTPFLLAWNAGERVEWTSRKIVEAAALLTCLIVTALLMSGFLFQSILRNAPFGFATVPFLLWAAFRFSPREAFGAAFLLFAINLAGTLAGHGQFSHRAPNAGLLRIRDVHDAVRLGRGCGAEARRAKSPRAESGARAARGAAHDRAAHDPRRSSTDSSRYRWTCSASPAPTAISSD